MVPVAHSARSAFAAVAAHAHVLLVTLREEHQRSPVLVERIRLEALRPRLCWDVRSELGFQQVAAHGRERRANHAAAPR